MAWWYLAAAAASAGSEYMAGKKAKRAAEGAAISNAALTRMENKENLRRMERAQVLREGAATALIGQSGIRMDKGTTAAQQMQSFKDEYARQRDWFKKTGEQRAKIARQGGQGVGTAQMYGAGATLMQGIANFGSSAYNNRQAALAGAGAGIDRMFSDPNYF